MVKCHQEALSEFPKTFDREARSRVFQTSEPLVQRIKPLRKVSLNRTSNLVRKTQGKVVLTWRWDRSAPYLSCVRGPPGPGSVVSPLPADDARRQVLLPVCGESSPALVAPSEWKEHFTWIGRLFKWMELHESARRNVQQWEVGRPRWMRNRQLVLANCVMLKPSHEPLWWSHEPCQLRPCSHLVPEHDYRWALMWTHRFFFQGPRSRPCIRALSGCLYLGYPVPERSTILCPCPLGTSARTPSVNMAWKNTTSRKILLYRAVTSI